MLFSNSPGVISRGRVALMSSSCPSSPIRFDSKYAPYLPILTTHGSPSKSIVLDNIYYDLNKADIREDAAIELDKLVLIMKDNPTISIELSSHTDDRATVEYNQNLSQRRAESAVLYIVSKGINKNRMTARGYGESQLIILNAKTEEEHQINRRTEFKVTSYEFVDDSEGEDNEERFFNNN